MYLCLFFIYLVVEQGVFVPGWEVAPLFRAGEPIWLKVDIPALGFDSPMKILIWTMIAFLDGWNYTWYDAPLVFPPWPAWRRCSKGRGLIHEHPRICNWSCCNTQTAIQINYLDMLRKNVKRAKLFVAFLTTKHPFLEVEVVSMNLCQVFSH